MIALLARAAEALKLSVLARGTAPVPGYTVNEPGPDAPTAVTFRETATAFMGTPQFAAVRSKARGVPAPRAGPASGPSGRRVSTRRQGVSV